MKEFKYCPYCSYPLDNVFIEGMERKFCSNCQVIHYINPKPTVAAIAEYKGSILLIKRGIEPGKGRWSLPSGFMEINETPEEACLRELLEETGMQANIIGLVDVQHEYQPMHGDLICITYHAELLPGTPVAGDDAAGIALVPIKEIKDLGFTSLNKAFQRFLKSR
jgi:8-oxo-dGTP diphosphatase